jgi:hypothetical protein
MNMKVSTNLPVALLAVLLPLSDCHRGPALERTDKRSGGEGERAVVIEDGQRCQVHGEALRRGRVKTDLGYFPLLYRGAGCLSEKEVKFPSSNLWTRSDYANKAGRQGYINVFYCEKCREAERRCVTEGALKNLAAYDWSTRLSSHAIWLAKRQFANTGKLLSTKSKVMVGSALREGRAAARVMRPRVARPNFSAAI